MICPCRELEACGRKGKDKTLVCPERRPAENMKYQGHTMIEAIYLFLD
jgi:ferredoxin-thioredoxin reductase catalytic subunit